MNVLFLTSSLQRFPGDSQVPFVLEQALAWKRKQPEDDIFVLAPHDPSAKRQEDLFGLKVYRFVYWWPKRWQKLAYPAILPNIRRNPFLLLQVPAFLIGQFIETLKLIKKHKIELIFAHWVMPQGLTAYIVHKFTHVPYGLKNYSSDLKVFKKFPLFGKMIARAVIRNAETLFCENTKLKEEAASYFNGKEYPSVARIKALSMGVTDLGKNRARGSKNYEIGFIGRLTEKKGIAYLFNALKVLAEKGIKPRVAVAGEGEKKEELMRSAGDLDIDFIGFVAGQDKRHFFDSTDSLVFPSVKAGSDVEGMPVALLEAIYYGTTVIASRATNIELLPEWDLIKNDIFLLKDPRDANAFAGLLERALNMSQEERKKKIDHTRSIFRSFNWDSRIFEYIRPLKERL